MRLIQVNLQLSFGGGEVYTLFLSKALAAADIPFDLVVHPQAQWWRTHDIPAQQIHLATTAEDLLGLPLNEPCWLLFHGPAHPTLNAALKARGHKLACFVHLPLYQRSAESFRNYDRLFAVSSYVLQGLIEAGLTQAWPPPLYGVAHLARPAEPDGKIRRGNIYDWDVRKVRDRLGKWLTPIVTPLANAISPPPTFSKRSGITIGVVSRITPIKQFPTLFASIAPVLREFANINLEIFGSGGYASVRDTRAALAPIADTPNRVRFWGQQTDVRLVYQQLDYLLTGLPEKEALGLNVIEAQLCGTPVLAPNAPPFSETVHHAHTGYLFEDPRKDGAHGFRSLLQNLSNGNYAHLNPLNDQAHLAKFSESQFNARVLQAMDGLEGLQPASTKVAT